MKGYRAFLMGTATDLPLRGFFLRDQRRDAVEGAADLRAFDGAASLKGVGAIQWNTKVNR